MSNVDHDWWRKEKALSIERKKEAARPTALAQPGETFLIVTEGVVTEPIYFDLLRKDLQHSAVRVKVQPGDESDPRHVIETAAREAKDQIRRAKKGTLGISEPAKFDQVWAVIDTDVAVRQGFWSEVENLAKARKVRLAHSTPCFEFWLLVHLEYTTRGLRDGIAAKTAIRHALGRDYSTNEEVACEALKTLISLWPTAVVHAERVRAHHEAAQTPAPANPSTDVDRLARALNDSAPEHLRRLI